MLYFFKRDLLEEGEVVSSPRGTECAQREKIQEIAGCTEKVSYRRGSGHHAWFGLEDKEEDDRAGHQALEVKGGISRGQEQTKQNFYYAKLAAIMDYPSKHTGFVKTL